MRFRALTYKISVLRGRFVGPKRRKIRGRDASLLGRQAVLAVRPRSNSRPSVLGSLQLTATAMVALGQLKRFSSRAGQPWPWNAMFPTPRVFLRRRPGRWLLSGREAIVPLRAI